METTVEEDMDDIEMMDFEDSPSLPTNDSVEKRKLSSVYETNTDSVAKTLSPKKSPKSQSRLILKARRVLPKSEVNGIESDLGISLTVDESLKPICILDTNILLSNLIQLKSVIITEEKLRETTTKSKLKSIIIPWIVVQELDGLKNRPKDKSVSNAIKFINEQLKKSKGLVKGENKSKKLSPNSKKLIQKVEEETNDDKIINCCLMSKTFDANNVIVISNDINLCNKAIMNDLNAMNWREFYRKYQSSDLSSLKTDDSQEDNEPKNKRLTKNSDNRSSRSSSGHLSATPLSRTSSKSSTSSRSPQKIVKLKTPIVIRYPNNSSNDSFEVRSNCNELTNNNNIPNESPLKFDDWIRFKDESEQKLLKFVEYVFRKEWNKDWKLMLEIDINNTNLREIVRLMRKEWFGIFSDHFNRDKSVKTLIDRVHTNLQKSETNHNLYYKDLQQLVGLVQQKFSQKLL